MPVLASAACLLVSTSLAGLAPAAAPVGTATVRPQSATAQASGQGSTRGAAPADTPDGSSAADPGGGAYYEFLRGRHLESLGRAAEALQAYERAAKLDPRSAQVRAEVAALHARQNRPADAIAAAKAALALDADNPEAHWVLGTVYAALVDAAEEEREAGDRSTAPSAAAKLAAALPTADEIIAHLEKARPARLYDNSLHLTLGRLYMEQENWPKAVTILDYVVEREPGAMEAAYLLAQAYEGGRQYDKAIATLEEAILFDPDSPRALAYLGELYGRVRKWDQAAAAFGRAAEQRPELVDLKVRQAAALVSAGKAAQARDVLREVAAANPKEARVLYMLAEADRAVQDYDSAEATAKKLIALAPNQPFGYHALAQVFAQRHQYRQIVDTLTPFVQSASPSAITGRSFAPVWVSLGYAHQELGEFDKAITAFDRARQAGGDDVSYDAYLVQANLAAGRTAKAVELAAGARARQPENLRLMNLEAQARLQHGERAKAIAILEEGVRANENEVQAHVALAGVLLEAKEFSRAESVLNKAAAQFPADINVPFQLGAVFEEQNKPAEAEKAFRAALAIDPLHAPTLNYLGYMLAERGQRLDEAVKLLSQAVQIDPYNGSYLDSLGWAYFKKGQLDQARGYLVKAGEQMPANSVVQDHVGDLLFAMRDVSGAVAAWQRALAGDGRSIDRASIERKIAQARKK